jgi:hypothetical protein
MIDGERTATATDAMKTFLASRRPGQTNIIVVTHSPNMLAAGLPEVAEGGSVIIRPNGAGWTVLGTVPANEWRNLPQ